MCSRCKLGYLSSTPLTAAVFTSHRIELVILNILNPIYMRWLGYVRLGILSGHKHFTC